MKRKEMIIIGVFIIAVVAISLIPFSNSFSEGATTADATTAAATTAAATTAAATTAAATTAAATTAAATTTSKTTSASPSITTAATTGAPKSVSSNKDFLNAVIQALSSSPDPSADKVKIYSIQGMISSLNTQNSATLLGEIGNPNNLNDPRLFLQYMNWFGSNCPIDSNNCTGLA